MEIKIEGNPGTGNSFQEIHIGNVENYNPNATTVINNNYGTRVEKSEARRSQPSDDIDTTPIRTEILNYVSCIRHYLKDEWKSRYMKVWEDILDLQQVSEKIYHPGKQQGTNFNRNLVANILCYLDNRGAYKEKYNASQLAEALEGDKDHSVRNALGEMPSADIKSRLDRYFE